MGSDIEVEICKEFETAQSLLQQLYGIQFKPPELYIGDKHRSHFITISSLKDIVRASMVLGVYDDEINGLFVPDSMIIEEDATGRIFTFIHECVHAFAAQKNPKLGQVNVEWLVRSKSKQMQEKGYVYIIFNEGLATHLSIEACLRSGKNDLIEKAEEERERLVSFFKEWTSPSSDNLALLAKIYKLDRNNWQKVIGRYLLRQFGVGLDYYKYDLGYYFMRMLQPNMPMIIRMIQRPPSTIQYIVYPETYMLTFVEG